MKTAILAITFLLLACVAPAQTAGERHVKTYNKARGLSNGHVVDITQDNAGYIWVATEDGLNRFDGHGFKIFDKENSGLSANELNCLAVLPSYPDTLWISTQRNGMCTYDLRTGVITPLDEPALRSSAVTAIVPAGDGGMWLAHYHYGVQYYNPRTREAKVYDRSNIRNLPRGAWAVADGPGDKIYVGHTGGGLSIVDTLTRRHVTITEADGLPGGNVKRILVDTDNNLWVGTDGGAALVNPQTLRVTPFVHDEADPHSIGAGQVDDIARHSGGELWFATSQGGVSVLNTDSYAYADISGARFDHLPVGYDTGGTSSRTVRSLFADSNGNMWIGDYRSGVDVATWLAPIFSRVRYLNTRSRLPMYNPVWCAAAAPSGDAIWYGGEGEIVRCDSAGCTPVMLPRHGGADESEVRALAFDSRGRLWVGTLESGCLIYDGQRAFEPVPGVPPNVRWLHAAPDGRMLVSTDRGLYESDGTASRAIADVNSQLPDRVVQDVWHDGSGRLWVGTFGGGLSLFDTDGRLIHTYNLDNGFPSNAINALRRDSRGRLWVATRNGVALFAEPEAPDPVYTVIPAVTKAGITHVKSIEEAADGSMWLSTNRGVYCIDATGSTIEFQSKVADVRTAAFIEGASVTDATGTIYFCSTDGIFTIAPGALGRELPPQPVRVTDLDISGSDRNTVSVSFNVLDPSMNELVDISYMLEGLSDSWVDTEGRNTVVFRDLPPGRYRLKVRQRVYRRPWSEPATLCEFEIEPPLWLTWWAKTLYALLALGAVVAGVLIARRRVNLRRQLQLERDMNLNRQRLNEERLRFYTNITHELRTPLTLIMGPLEDLVSDPTLPSRYSYRLQTIRDSASTLLNQINGILEFRKTETQNRRLSVRRGNVANLVREIGLRFKELNRNQAVDFVLDIDADSRPIYFDSGIITTILNNLLSNAVKYTPRGTITLSCHQTDDSDGSKTLISVADTGYGISRANLDHIFERYFQENGAHQASGTGIGLALVKSLTDIHEGRISVASTEGRGSTFTLALLSDNIYPGAIHGSEDAPASPEKPVEEPDSPESRDSRVRLLVVEDNADIREYISRALSDEFDVVTAANGLEGLRLAQQENPGLIVSDIMMPEMDGIAMCRSIKEDILTSHIPVILLTAKDTLDDRESGYDAGADSYLTKPFSAKLLRSRIHSLLRIRRLIAGRFMATEPPVATAPADNSPEERHSESEDARRALSKLDRRFMDKLIDIIDGNLANEELGVALIADKMCMSTSTLYRKVNAILGVSTNEYIRHRRLSQAVEMLVHGDMTVVEIAAATGFSSHSSFAKAFKKEYGMTATEYAGRRKTQAAAPDNTDETSNT